MPHHIVCLRRMLRRSLQCVLDKLNSLARSPALGQRLGEIQRNPLAGRIKAMGLAELPDGPGIIAMGGQSSAEHAVRQGAVRFATNRDTADLQCRVGAAGAEVEVRLAAVYVCCRMI